MLNKLLLILPLFAVSLFAMSQNSPKLSGNVIGYFAASNTSVPPNAFDGDLNTYFSSSERSNAWVGLDLGSSYRITGIAYSPRNSSSGPRQTRLAVFEGSNREDFLDAVPLYMTSEDGVIGQMSYHDINVSRSFRYVRYVGPNESCCNIAEVAFYGEKVTDGAESEGKNDHLYKPTNLPLVVIHVADNVNPYDKENDLEMITTIISADGTPYLSEPGTIRLRGNASMSFPKKPYRIKFEKKQRVLDSPAKAKKWTLINNYGDKTLMRNILAFDLSRRLEMEYTPFCTPVDVMVNGEYKGCYQLCDQIEVGSGRVDIEKMDTTCISGEELTGGYFIEIDAYANQEISYFYSAKSNPVTIKSPADDEILPEQSAYIEDFFNTMEASLYKTTYTNEETGYRKYLDLESFLKHFIIGEFSGNTDTYWSTYMYKRRSEDKFYVGPVWDFDLAFENDNRTYPINNQSDYIYASKGSYAGDMRNFVNRIVKRDSAAKDQLKKKWANLRTSGKITENSLLEYIDSQAELLDESQKLNFMRWDILNEYVHQNPKVYGSYKGEVDNVRNYVVNRIKWFDKKLNFDASGIVNVSSPALTDCHVYNLSGIYVGTFGSSEEARCSLPGGVYIIRQNGKNIKARF